MSGRSGARVLRRVVEYETVDVGISARKGLVDTVGQHAEPQPLAMRLPKGGKEREGKDKVPDLAELDDKDAVRTLGVVMGAANGPPDQPLVGAVCAGLKEGGER